MAQTKVKLVSNGVITVDNLHTNHGITTDHVGEGSVLYYTDARVANYLTTNNYITTTDVANLETVTSISLNANTLSYVDEAGNTTNLDLSLYLDDTNLARLVSGTLDGATGIATFTRDDATTFTVDLSSLTPSETDPVFTASAASGITSTNISNWNTAYGWGNHASAGYLTSFDITTQTDPKYLRSDTSDTMTGNLTVTGTSHLFGGYSEPSGVFFEIASDNYVNFYQYAYNNAYSYINTTYNYFGIQYRPSNGVANKLTNTVIDYLTPTADANAAYTTLNINNSQVLKLTKTDALFSVDAKAPIYYDSNNTGYYVDPASTSNIRKTNIIALGSGWEDGLNLYSADTTNRWNFLVDQGASNAFRIAYNNSDRLYFYTGGQINSSGTLSSNTDMRSPIFYDSNDTGYYVDPASTSNLSGLTVANQISGSVSGSSNSIANTGYGNGNFTWKQDYGTFGPYSGWHNYLISNHGNGSNYYNTIIAMPFWGVPRYSRLEGGTQRGPYDFWTSENMDAPNKSGTSYYQTNTWMQFNGNYGLYWPNNYGAHFYPNDYNTYTQFRLNGSKNGYGGIVDSYSAVSGIMYDSAGNGGVYREANGRWYFYHHVGNNCTGINTSTTSASYGLYVDKGIYSTGDVTAYSDVRKKTNIATIDSALDKVTKLRGVYYDRIDDLEKGRQVGVIAQEVNEVLPEAVTYAEDVDEYGVKYGNIVGLLIEAIKEQQQQIDELKSLLNK